MSTVSHIAVVGAGTMGAGIAQVASINGCRVHLIDTNSNVLDRARDQLEKRLSRLVEKGRIPADERDAALSRVITTDKIESLEGVELAVEAVIENLDVKHTVFKALEEATDASAVLATNTSSLRVGDIARGVGDPGRIVGMHFFNPAPLMPLVEVIAHDGSSEDAMTLARQAAEGWGKTPVRTKDTPGFIVNRVARGYYLEALRLLDEGVADVVEIDTIMRTHGKFRMGPFELMDLVGLDVNYAVSTSVWEQMDRHPRFTPHDIQRKLVEEGHLGRKSGRGFYQHSGTTPISAFDCTRRSFDLGDDLQRVVDIFATRATVFEASVTEQYVFARILCAIINEAGSAFDGGVATSDDIDTAMRLGTNYPNGPLAWADEIGHATVRHTLDALNASVGDGRYDPATLFC